MSHGGNKPYFEKKISKRSFLREFNANISEEELAWHRDAEDREIEILEGKNWKFQHDNCLPFILKPVAVGSVTIFSTILSPGFFNS